MASVQCVQPKASLSCRSSAGGGGGLTAWSPASPVTCKPGHLQAWSPASPILCSVGASAPGWACDWQEHTYHTPRSQAATQAASTQPAWDLQKRSAEQAPRSQQDRQKRRGGAQLLLTAGRRTPLLTESHRPQLSPAAAGCAKAKKGTARPSPSSLFHRGDHGVGQASQSGA